MPDRSITINNAIKDTDSSSTHDRYIVENPAKGPWNPQTFYPGEGTTIQLKNGFGMKLSNPSTHGNPSSVNIYFWINNGKLNSYTPAHYGVSVNLDEYGNVQMVDSAPGSLFPSGGIGKRFIAYDPTKKGQGYFDIYNMKNITIKNSTQGDLPFFINTSSPQPFPISLTDFTRSKSAGSIPKGGNITTQLYNNVTDPPNCGVYFFASGSADTDPAIAASVLSLSDSGMQNLNGSAKVSNSGTAYTVTGGPSVGGDTSSNNPNNPNTTTSSDSSNTTTTSDSSSNKIWIWIGAILGIIALIVVIGMVIHFSRKKTAPPSYK